MLEGVVWVVLAELELRADLHAWDMLVRSVYRDGGPTPRERLAAAAVALWGGGVVYQAPGVQRRLSLAAG